MSTSIPKNKLGVFLKEARKIIQREGKLNDKALADIRTLGTQQGLTPTQLGKAMAMLQTKKPASGMSVANKGDEKASFRDVVEMEVKREGILTPRLKRKLLACAAHQTQLPQDAAVKIVMGVANQMGVPIANEKEAYQRLQDQVEAAVQAGKPDVQTLQGLYSAAHQIGQDRKVIDRLIASARETKTAANNQTLLYAGLILVPVLVLALGLGIWASMPKQQPQQVAENSTDPESPGNTKPEPNEEENNGDEKKKLNHWWKKVDGLEEALASLKTTFPKDKQTFDDLSIDDNLTRDKAYHALTVKKLPDDFYPSQDARPHLIRFIAGCYAGEPSDFNAEGLRTTLVGKFPKHGYKIHKGDAANFPRRMWYARAAVAALKHPQLPELRRDDLRFEIEKQLEEPIDLKAKEEDLLESVHTTMCKRFLKNVLITAASDPNTALEVFDDLDATAAPFLPERTRRDARADLLVQVLSQPKVDPKLLVPMFSKAFPKFNLELKETVLNGYRDASPQIAAAIEPTLTKGIPIPIQPGMSQKAKAEGMIAVVKNQRYFLALAGQRSQKSKIKPDQTDHMLQETLYLAHASTLGSMLAHSPPNVGELEKLKTPPSLVPTKKKETKTPKEEPNPANPNPVPGPAPGGPPPVLRGALSTRSPLDRYRGRLRCRGHTHVVPMITGHRYVIDMRAPYDTYLYLESPTGVLLRSDDDGGPGNQARIYFTCPVSGNYQLRATSYRRSYGPYTITIRPGGAFPAPAPLFGPMPGQLVAPQQQPQKVKMSELLPLIRQLKWRTSAFARTQAFQRLASLSDGKLNPAIGRVLAEYLLEYKQKNEFDSKMQSLRTSKIKESRELKLACVDYLSTKAMLFRTRVEEVLSALLEKKIVLRNEKGWKREARILLLRDVLGGLKAPNHADAASRELAKLYLQQGQALGIKKASLPHNAGPSEMLATLIQHFAARLKNQNLKQEDQRLLADVQDRLRVTKFIDDKDLSKTVALQRQWFRLLALHVRISRPTRADQVASIQRELQAADAKIDRVLTQLRDGERHLLRLWLILHKQD